MGSRHALAVLAIVVAGMPAIAEAVVESSESCAACHRTIHETWKQSAHAHSLDNEIFLQSFRETEATQGKKLALLCLGCHAPLVAINGDVDLEQRVTWEGVSCEVCHSLVSVNVSGPGPRRVLEPGPVKRGPIADAPADAHEVAYSELHTKADACAWCHEYANPKGVQVLSTYSEWKVSEAAGKGKTCQSCHMGATMTDVVEPRAERVAGASINLHRVPGGHSLDQLHKALGLGIRPRRDDDALDVEITVRNKGAGHAVPTGMPGRRVILEVEIKAGTGVSYSERRVYEKTFVDGTGRPVTRDRDYFAAGVELRADTRIGPDEHRIESFRFPIPPDQTAYLTVRLHYEHSPMGYEEGRTWSTFFSEKRTIAAAPAADPGS